MKGAALGQIPRPVALMQAANGVPSRVLPRFWDWKQACFFWRMLAKGAFQQFLGELQRLQINAIALAIETGFVLVTVARVQHRTGNSTAATSARQGASRFCATAERKLREFEAEYSRQDELRGRLFGLQQALEEFLSAPQPIAQARTKVSEVDPAHASNPAQVYQAQPLKPKRCSSA
jgi:hypothetical protein